MDVLITPSPDRGGDESFRADSIVRLVQSLTEVGLLTDHLTLPEQFLSSILIKELKKKSQHDSNTSSAFSDIMALDGSTSIACRASYMGVCKLAQEGSIHRRIDIKVRCFRSFVSFLFHSICVRFILDQCMLLLCCTSLEAIISIGRINVQCMLPNYYAIVRSMRYYAKRRGYSLSDKVQYTMSVLFVLHDSRPFRN